MGNFCRWAENLDSTDFDQVRHLVEYGYSMDPAALSEELQNAIVSAAGDVLSTGLALLKALGRHNGQDSIIITSGFGQ